MPTGRLPDACPATTQTLQTLAFGTLLISSLPPGSVFLGATTMQAVALRVSHVHAVLPSECMTI